MGFIVKYSENLKTSYTLLDTMCNTFNCLIVIEAICHEGLEYFTRIVNNHLSNNLSLWKYLTLLKVVLRTFHFE